MEQTTTAKCKVCGKEYPQTTEYFGYNQRYGFQSTCKECRKKKYNDTKMKKNKEYNPLQEATPRQLMEELRRRGYEGTLTYVEVRKINLSEI